MTKDYNGPATLLVLLVGLFAAVIVYAGRAGNEFDARCRARGGEPVHIYMSRPLCLQPGAVISAEEP